MKKLLILLSVFAALNMSACGNENTNSSPTETISQTVTDAETERAAEEETTSGIAEETAAAEIDNYYEYAQKIINERNISDMSETVPYDTFKGYTYYSRTAERDTNVNVLLPPDYDENKEYPVLYILHGFYDDENWMARDVVGIPQMLTELYEKGEAEEMIVVLPYIFTSKEMPRCTGMDLENSLAYDNFINDLTADLMPFIEENFSVKKGRENTAITGFSMGGREALFISLSMPETFGYVGACCPAPGLVKIDGSPMHPGQLSEDEVKFTGENVPRLLFISAANGDGAVGNTPMSYHLLFKTNGTEHIWDLMNGTGHDHTSVRPHLYKFLSVIFRGERN